MSLFLFLSVSPVFGQTLSLGTDQVYPRSNLDGRGFEDLIVKEAFRRIGKEVRISFLPSERALLNVQDGIDDGTFSRIKGLEETYPNMLLVPYRVSNFAFTVFAKENVKRIERWEDLAPYNVGFVNGWKYPEKYVLKARSIHKVRHDDTLFELLRDDKLDVAIHESIGGALLLKRKGITGIAAQLPPLGDPDMYMYMNRRHAGLVPLLTEALKQMDQDGVRQAIIDRVLTEAGIQ